MKECSKEQEPEYGTQRLSPRNRIHPRDDPGKWYGNWNNRWIWEWNLMSRSSNLNLFDTKGKRTPNATLPLPDVFTTTTTIRSVNRYRFKLRRIGKQMSYIRYMTPCGKMETLSKCEVCSGGYYYNQQPCAYHCGHSTSCKIAGLKAPTQWCGDCRYR
ncbi:hypothetical protein [Bacteroides sp.]|uniref:hypothetical protein n=1 Tax=Bacteroides sp. TaxID=29523 RepID=UPI00260F8D23|nr:hypothetical protein [Bacteroides sp.]MDD3039047.1 hypothetical protein [Bacteroides sp.]